MFASLIIILKPLIIFLTFRDCSNIQTSYIKYIYVFSVKSSNRFQLINKSVSCIYYYYQTRYLTLFSLAFIFFLKEHIVLSCSCFYSRFSFFKPYIHMHVMPCMFLHILQHVILIIIMVIPYCVFSSYICLLDIFKCSRNFED